MMQQKNTLRQGLLGIVLLTTYTMSCVGKQPPDALPQKTSIEPVAVVSPNGEVRVVFSLEPADSAPAVPHYKITFKGRPVVTTSSLQIDLEGGATLGTDCMIEDVHTRRIDETYRQHPGKRSEVVNRCSEAVVTLLERSGTNRRWKIAMRAYDDGAAFRYLFPKQDNWTDLVIERERTAFSFPEKTVGCVLPLNTFTGPYEKLYERRLLASLPEEWLIGVPLLTELPGVG